MNRVTIVRRETTDEGTFGILYLNGEKICVTGELPKDYDHDGDTNERSRECIPAGVYPVLPRSGNVSSKFKYDHYILQNVPNRSYILIHKGNWCGARDKGYKCDVEGCILVGTGLGILDKQKAVINSTTAFSYLSKVLGKEEFELEIRENFE